MFNSIDLKKITATSLLAILLTGFLLTEPSSAGKKDKKGKKKGGIEQVIDSSKPKKEKKACKNNNGIGNNYDVEYTIGSETRGIRIDPGNKGQMSKFKRDLAAQGFTQEQIDSAVTQIWDAEKKAKGGGKICPGDSTVGSDYTTILTSMETFQGQVNYVVTGGTLRALNDNYYVYSDSCVLKESSAAQLSGIPDNATIQKAYLYWAGSGGEIDNTVTFNGTPVTADKTYQDTFPVQRRTDTVISKYFQGVKDVTSIVASNRNGSYSFTDLSVNNSGEQCEIKATLSAWSLIVIFEDPAITKLNTIQLYEGIKASRNEKVNYTLDGIKVSSNPIAQFSMLLWEGDESLDGSNEYFKFNNNLLTDQHNPLENQFNSSINSLGLTNTYGIDLDTFDVSSYVSEGQTSITGSISTNNDLVIQGAALVMVSDELAKDNSAPIDAPNSVVYAD